MRYIWCIVGVVVLHASLAAESPVYVEEQGLVVMEMETTLPAGGWEIRTDKAGYSGTGYGFFSGANSYGGSAGAKLEFRIMIVTPGRYTMHFRCSNEGADRHDLNNDLWAQMDDGPTYKTFTSSEEWKWGARFDHHPEGKPEAFYDLEPGLHTLRLSGRSHGFHVDRVVLFLPNRESAAHDLATRETRGIPIPPDSLTDERIRAGWLAGQLGQVWKWAERNREEPGAGETMQILAVAWTEALSELNQRYQTDPLSAMSTAEYLAERYRSAPREDELKDLLKEWKRDPRLKQEMRAHSVVAKLRELDADVHRHSGANREKMEAQLAQGRELLAEKFGETAVAQRYLGSP